MAYGNSFNFRVSNFANLEHMYKETPPIKERGRGTDRDIRPLGNRNQKHARVEKIDNDTYACTFYDSRCVIYRRNGQLEINHAGWVTQSTRGFIDACLPWKWGANMVQSMIHIIDKQTHKAYIVGATSLIISDYNSEVYEVSNMVIPTKRKVNREESKAKREAFKPFLTFARGFMDVLNIEVPKLDDGWYVGQTHRNTFLSKPESYGEEKYLDVLSAFVYQGYHPKSYEQIKRVIMKEATVYDRVLCPVGDCQKR
jgi:hypothetical protein